MQLRVAVFAVGLTGCAIAGSAPVSTSSSSAAGHGDSPVEFLPWSPASFERAAAEDKLILVNVIATWCHWCHVMDEQTFADPEVAGLLAEHFVVIRVDSDARPDLSERYRAWGWPATAFLSPAAEPALNLRGYRDPAVFAALLRELIAEHDAGHLRRLEARAPSPAPRDSDLAEVRARAQAQLDGYFDLDGLGWGDAQKYPWPEPIDYAFWRARLADDTDWQPRALATLEAERALIDPVDGGMYQYSLRGVWDRPHFERITMIQAGAIETYAHAAMITHDSRWLDPAARVAQYMLDDMQDPNGGFHASQDADLRLANGTTIVGADYFALDRADRRALGIPRVDTAIYADLNGLMIHALTELYRANADPRALAGAIAAGERLLASHQRPDGGFAHGTAGSKHDPLAYLADQAAVGWAFVALHRTTADPRWLSAALGVAEFMHDQLRAEQGGYFAHTLDPRAVGVFAERRIPLPDNGLAAQFLIELHQLVDGDGSIASPWLERAHASVLAVGTTAEIESRGKVVGRYLIALELLLSTRFDLTIVANSGDPDGDALWRAALSHWEPRAAIERAEPGQRYPDIGGPAAYLCSDQACSRPIRMPERMAADIDGFVGASSGTSAP